MPLNSSSGHDLLGVAACQPSVAVALSLKDGSRARGVGRPNGQGGSRGKYSSVDGDLPGVVEYLPGKGGAFDGDLTMGARTDVPAQAVAHRGHPARCESSGPRAGRSRDETFDMLHINIRSFSGHAAELNALVQLRKIPPAIVCLNETWLDKSTEQVELNGYQLTARRDRQDGQDDR